MCRGQSRRAPGEPKNKPNRSKRLRQERWRSRFDKACSFLMGRRRNQLRWHDNFAQDPIVVVGRVAQATDVDFRAMRQDSARVLVGAESPFTMIFAHPRVSDAAEWQIVNRRLKGA